MKIIDVQESEAEKDKWFFKLLYDERLAEDFIWIPKAVFWGAGGLNCKIKAKQKYELLLRLAERNSIAIRECSEEKAFSDEYALLDPPETKDPFEGIRTDSYIISRYKDKLLKYGCFDEVVESFLLSAKESGFQEEAAAILERMLGRQKEYYDIDDAVRPVLIYKGVDICYNVLNIFAEQFGAALERMGAKVEYFDPEKEDVRLMRNAVGKRYRAIIGWQTYMFSITMQSGERYLHDAIYAPKFNFIFDHPIWVRQILTRSPQTVRILTHDPGYVNFCSRYYKKEAYLFPPAGTLPSSEETEKKYDISFVGSYEDYRRGMVLIHQMERKTRFLANRFLLKLRKQTEQTADEAFYQALRETGETYTDEEYLEKFFQCKSAIFCVMHYYRAKVIETLLQAGCRVDVFGNSWEGCALKKYPGFICHPDLLGEECMKVWQQSRLSLNIMSWHKGGFTERMANIMLCRAVLVTDYTTYLDGKFEHGKDALIFRLDALEELPKMIKERLNQPQKLEKIAQSGFEKAKERHTWDCRAKEFLEGL